MFYSSNDFWRYDDDFDDPSMETSYAQVLKEEAFRWFYDWDPFSKFKQLPLLDNKEYADAILCSKAWISVLLCPCHLLTD